MSGWHTQTEKLTGKALLYICLPADKQTGGGEQTQRERALSSLRDCIKSTRESPRTLSIPHTPRLRDASTQSNALLINNGPISSFQRRCSRGPCHPQRFSLPILSVDAMVSLALRPRAPSQALRQTLQIFRDAIHLWWLLLPPVYLLNPLIPASPCDSISHASLWRLMPNNATCQSRLLT